MCVLILDGKGVFIALPDTLPLPFPTTFPIQAVYNITGGFMAILAEGGFEVEKKAA